MKGFGILSKAFSACIEVIMWFLSLILFMCYITFIDLHMLSHLSSLEWNQLDCSVWSF
jgi:uncharacterized membrane protein (DUF373 family)